MAEENKEQLEDIEAGESQSTEEKIEDALKRKQYEEAKALLSQEDFSDEGLRRIGIGVDKQFNPNTPIDADYDVLGSEGEVIKKVRHKVADYQRENSDLFVSVEQMVAASHSLKDLLVAIQGAKTAASNIKDVSLWKSLIPFREIKDVVEKKEFKRNMETIGNVTKHMSQEGQDIFNSLDEDKITPSRGEAAAIAGDVGLTATVLAGNFLGLIPTMAAYVTHVIQKAKTLDNPAQIIAMLDELEEYVQQRYDKLNEVFSGMNSALIDAGVQNLEQLAARAA